MLPPFFTKYLKRPFSGRFGAFSIFVGVYLCLSFAIQLVLLAKAAHNVTWDLSLLAAFGWGIIFDLGAAAWLSLPLILILILLPAGAFRNRWVRAAFLLLALVMINALLFGAVSEWFFWDEFGTRFNFIAVDYLAYTSEVIGNIWESYPMSLILTGIGAGSLLVFLGIHLTGLPAVWLQGSHEPLGRRAMIGGLWFSGMLVFGLVLSSNWLPRFQNNYNRELAKNGTWALFAAYFSNELPYEDFYRRLPLEETFDSLREELVEDGSILLQPDAMDSLRYVSNEAPELHLNIIQITVESLSAEFLGVFNPDSDLTPNLDALAAKSLLFENFYATGTRTIRGMEALTLSLPPTPGRSIVKRPRNENLFTLGSVLNTRGYDTAFIYGGHGYFDNMNSYFSNNGYRVIDRSKVADSDVTFSNIWGACDEDLLRWTTREADAAYKTGKPFHFFVMTTSNHRPYTFPDGKIDLPSKESGREGGVKYTDFAIGQFIREASSRPWFKETIFVIVADHCGSSAGKTDVPVPNYHIPLIIYAPGGQISPGRVSALTSQMDFAPTLLGLLNWSYPSRFFGHDVRSVAPDQTHALIGNYQKLGHLENGELVLLTPMGGQIAYAVDLKASTQIEMPPSDDGMTETISYYEAASHLFRNGLYKELTSEENTYYAAQGRLNTKANLLAAGSSD